MRVTLDGRPAAFGWSGCATLGDLARRAEEACALQGQVLSSLRADGQELDLGDREPWASRPLAPGLEEVALGTMPLARLLAETLDEMKAHFPALRSELQAVAEGLRGGRETQALQSLGRVVALWQACLTVATDAGAVLGRATDPDGLEQLRAAILPLDEALRRRDLVLVADLCAYELPPLVDRWEELLGALRTAAGE